MPIKLRIKSLKSKIGACVHDTAFWGTALLMTGFVATTPAFSQKMNLDAEGQWSVSRIGSDLNQDSKPYCVMARKFDNNVIMSVAKNEDGQRSLAVDFQTPRLAVEKTYQVVLNAGGNVARGFEVRPVTDKAFVIRFGQDYKFFDAIEQGSFMTVSYGGEELRFDTGTFGEGRKRLSECLHENDTNVMASAKVSPDDTAKAKQVAQIANVNVSDKRIGDIRSIEPASGVSAGSLSSAESDLVESLRRKIASLEDANRKLQSERVGAHSHEQKVEGLQRKVSSLSRELASEKSARAKLKEDLEAARSDSAKYSSLFKSAKAENSRLQGEVQRMSGSDDDTSSIRAAVNALREQNSELRQRLASLQAREVSLEAQRDQIDSLRKMIVSMEDEIVKLEEDKLELENILASTGSSIATSAGVGDGAENDHINTSAKTGEVCLSSNNWDLERATRRYQEAQREIQRLGDSLRRQKQECQSEIRSVEAQLFSPEVTSNAQNERFIEMRQRMMQMRDQIKKQRVLSKRRIMELEKELSEASSGLKRANAEVREVRAELRSAQSALETANEREMQLEIEVDELSQREVRYNSSRFDDSRGKQSREDGLDRQPQSLANSEPQVSSQEIQTDKLPDSVLSRKLTSRSMVKEDVNALLALMDIDVKGSIMSFPTFNSDTKRASYKWDTGALLGSADIYSQLSPQDYLMRLRSSCGPEFSISKDYHAVDPEGDSELFIYKISCGEGDVLVTQSTILVESNSQLKSVSHEANTDDDLSTLLNLHEETISLFKVQASS